MSKLSVITKKSIKKFIVIVMCCFFLLIEFSIVYAADGYLSVIEKANMAISEAVLNQQSPVVPDLAALLACVHNRYYVDGSMAVSGDGTTWTKAFKTIREAAVAAVDKSEIWVRAGIYPVNPPPYNTPGGIMLDKELFLFGGFAGHETSLDERQWDKNKTVINAEKKARCFFITKDAYLDGFTMMNGLPGEVSDRTGGAVKITDSSPVLKHCVFLSNFAWNSGGAIFLANGSPFLQDCIFKSNACNLSGGAVYVENGCPVCLGCSFIENAADCGAGGALYGPAHIIRCFFNGNCNRWYTGGGAIYTAPQFCITIKQSVFYNNSAKYPGGVLVGNGTITDCRFEGNKAGESGGAIVVNNDIAIVNCVFANNTSNSKGGAIWAKQNTNTYIANSVFINGQGCGGAFANEGASCVLNCTFWGNSGSPGAIYNGAGSNLLLINSILWNNKGNPVALNTANAFVDVYYCVLDQKDLTLGNNNVLSDPLFIAPLAGNFHLQPNSPCIDTGANTDIDLLIYDFEGDNRLIDGNGDLISFTDIGADEYKP